MSESGELEGCAHARSRCHCAAWRRHVPGAKRGQHSWPLMLRGPTLRIAMSWYPQHGRGEKDEERKENEASSGALMFGQIALIYNVHILTPASARGRSRVPTC